MDSRSDVASAARRYGLVALAERIHAAHARVKELASALKRQSPIRQKDDIVVLRRPNGATTTWNADGTMDITHRNAQ